MNTEQKQTLDDLFYDLSLVEAEVRIEYLDQLARIYPEHASELTDFAVDLALRELKQKSIDVLPVADSDPIVVRAMSKLQNRLFELDHERTLGPPTITSAPINPFGSLTRSQLRDFAQELGANSLFAIKLRDRGIRPDTFSPGFCRRAAELLRIPDAVMIAHLSGKPEIRPDARFKSDAKPEAPKQESLEEALLSSGLTDEQQDRLRKL